MKSLILDVRQLLPVNTGISVVIAKTLENLVIENSNHIKVVLLCRPEGINHDCIKSFKENNLGINIQIYTVNVGYISKLKLFYNLFGCKYIGFNLPLSLVGVVLSRHSSVLCHDFFPLVVPGYTKFLKKVLYYFVNLFVISNASRIICNSFDSRDKLFELFGPFVADKTYVRPLGTSVDVNKDIHVSAPFCDRGPVFYYIGDSRYNKNLVVVGKIFKVLDSMGFQTVVFTRDSPEEFLRISTGFDSTKFCVGNNLKEYRSVLLQTGVLVFPSINEGFGIPVIDAVENGHHVITTRFVPAAYDLDSRIVKFISISPSAFEIESVISDTISDLNFFDKTGSRFIFEGANRWKSLGDTLCL